MRFEAPRFRLALLAALVATVALHRSPPRPRSGRPIDTRGWALSDFVAHLRQHGVHLRVVPGPDDGRPQAEIYLTEDPDATWQTMQQKRCFVERVREWRGTVRVWYAWPDLDQPGDEWGPFGWRVGRFLLFGDERVLRRIQEVCCP